MSDNQPKEISGLTMAAGFIAGLLVAVIVFTLAFSLHHEVFLFDRFFQLHREHPLLILIDLFPLMGLLLGYLVANRHVKQASRISELHSREQEKNAFIRSAIENLTAGNLNATMTREDIDREIVHSLESLQSRLKENREANKKSREEDQQRNWTSHGLAEFGDLLRAHSSDREKLSYAVISGLVRYLGINQGGFFVISGTQDDRWLEMIACHAYDRKKFPDQKVKWGEGLIGAVAIEKKSYYTDKIPDGYLTITSGLGRANPTHLLIVPLVLNDEVFGLFELASFKPFENYQVQFVERVAENTATTLNILYSNLRTEQLLKETQEQASLLSAQEEKVRENIEALKKTQAEAALQSEQFISFTNTVNHTLVRAEYDTNGVLLYANTRFLRKLGYSGNREVEGKHISMFIHAADQEWFNETWNKLASGGVHFEGYMRHVTKLGQDLWTMATYTCVRREDGSPEKVLFLAIDSTRQKEESLGFEGQINAIDKLSVKAEFRPDGRIMDFNAMFENTFNYGAKEIENKNVFDFFTQSDQERFNEVWEQVIAGTPYQGQLKMMGKFEQELWFRATFTSVIDLNGEVDRILLLGFGITKEKELEISMRDQNEVLKKNEEEMRLKSMDLKQTIDKLQRSQHEEKEALQRTSSRYADILAAHPLPLVSINNQGVIIFFNKEAEKFWKKSSADVVNRHAEILFGKHPEEQVLRDYTDPARTATETACKKANLSPAGQPEKEATISIIKTTSGPEYIYTMIIHSY